MHGVDARTPLDQDAARKFVEQAKNQARAEAAKEWELSPLEKEWGIKLLGIRLTAAGYALDMRYEVLDPEKAAPLLVRSLSRDPHVLVTKSGARLGVPRSEKVGAMRTSVRTASQIKKHRRYFVLFANPGRHVESGDKVDVTIGPFKAEQLIVQ